MNEINPLPPTVNRSRPIEYRTIDNIVFVAYDLLEYFNTKSQARLGYIAEPVDRSIVGDISTTAATLDDVFNTVSTAYSTAISKSFNLNSKK